MKQDDIYLTNSLVVRVRYRSYNILAGALNYYSSTEHDRATELVSIDVNRIVMVISNSDENLRKGDEPDIVVGCE